MAKGRGHSRHYRSRRRYAVGFECESAVVRGNRIKEIDDEPPMTGHNDFMDRIKGVIVDYEAIAAGLEAGRDKVHRTSRSGEKEDISLKTTDHYKEVVARHEAKKK
jgi:hypothetical protein